MSLPLLKYRLKDGSERKIESLADTTPITLATADLYGAIEFSHADQPVRLDASHVESLQFVPKSSLKVTIGLDPPLSDFPAKAYARRARFVLSFTNAWKIECDIPWVISNGSLEPLRLNEWIRDVDTDQELITGDFRFDRFGLTQTEIGGFRKVRMGLFAVPGEPSSRLIFVCMLATDLHPGKNRRELAIANFQKVEIELDASDFRAAVIAHFDAASALRDGLDSPWSSVFQWRIDGQLGPEEFLNKTWNATVEATTRGRRGASAGRPWWPVPKISGLDWDNERRWHRLIFAPSIESRSWRLLKFEYGGYDKNGGSASPVRATATFDWYDDATLSHSSADQLKSRQLSVSGEFELAPDPKPPAVGHPASGAALAQCVDRILFAASSQSIASWRFKIDRYEKLPGWLGFGSVDIRPDTIQPFILDCKLVGTWDAAQCDVYSQVELVDLPCQFRMSNAGDPLPQALVASFDVMNRKEDELHRATLPVVASLGRDAHDNLIDGSQPGRLQLRLRAEAERDAVIQLRLQRRDQASTADKSLYLQTRPFNFARIWPVNFDEEAGLDFGYWRSDDPDGPQWRLPDATVEFDLPPQTVAEEMERGARFWPIKKEGNNEPIETPYINHKLPIRYRFSPPTHVKVRPSWVERRYHKNANNLSDILDGARVEAFTTELLYPIQLDFEIDSDRKPVIDIAESGTFIGKPTANLPVREEDRKDETPFTESLELVQDLYPDDIAEWFAKEVARDASAEEKQKKLDPLQDFHEAYDQLRWEHSANRAQFVARVAQFHVHDPYLPDRQLMLSEGLNAHFRMPEAIKDNEKRTPGSMPPIMSPLPNGADLEEGERAKISFFLGREKVWGQLNEGALRAGAIHTIEFPSELVAVLTAPGAVGAFIETLSFSTLGASGSSSVSFDNGRTTFSVEISDGQVWRIRKIRLGRVALLWNKAKHVIVYERSVVPSLQFQDQQNNPLNDGQKTFGWPILRKTEEYVEPIEMIRVFTEESDPELGSPGFAHSSEFITPRIYVDGAWGRDLKHGYEIPLWNPADTSGFYPKPLAAINGHTGTGTFSKAWHVNPDELYFYTNTEKENGSDSNTWKPFYGVDLADGGPSRLENCTNVNISAGTVLDSERLPSPRIEGLRRKRFDLVVCSDGPVNLQHGRGETQMLAAGVDVLSFARTAATSPTNVRDDSPVAKAVQAVQKVNDYAARVDAIRDQAHSFVRDLPALFLKFQFATCESLQKELETRTRDLFARVDATVSDAFAKIPDLGVEEKIGDLSARVRKEMFEWALPLVPSFRPIIDELRAQLALARENSLASPADLERIRKHLATIFDIYTQAIAVAKKKLTDGLVAPIAQCHDRIDKLSTELNVFTAAAKKWFADSAANFKSNATSVRSEADRIATVVQATNVPYLASPLKRIESAARAISQIAEEASSLDDANVQAFITRLKTDADTIIDQVAALVGSFGTLATAFTEATFKDASSILDDLHKKIEEKLTQAWATAEEKRVAIDAILGWMDRGLGTAAKTIEEVCDEWRTRLAKMIDSAVLTLVSAMHCLARPVVMLAANLRETTLSLQKNVSAELKRIRTTIEGLIKRFVAQCALGEAERKKLLDEFAGQCKALAVQVETRITGAVTSLVDEETIQRMKAWTQELENHKDTVSKGIKLVKAIGSLPELPHLKFNADRVEYVFDDLKKQIATSPFAARMREIDSGLKELGLAVPVRELMDQLVPDTANLDFNKVFRDFGGIDLRKLFAKFRIPGLDKDNIKITHGIDTATRSAWIKSRVSTNYPESRDVFAAGPLAVKTAAMSLQATSDVRVDLNGQRRAETKGELRADWCLDFKGAKLVTFRDVSVVMDGGKFDFNIKPEKVELHPSLKFISDIAKTLGEKVPPCIELVRDSRGVITGARANLSTVIQKPLTLGVVKIGSLVLIGGLSLTLEEGFKFAIAGHMSVGTKTAPIFVQINLLGGGMWLEVEARFVDGEISYLGNVGLALGSMESFNIGGVARGGYTLLLFAYAQFKSGAGGSFRGGLSITGNARILGIVNAYVLLLIEVIHGEGKPKGKGLLDVEVEVCKWYSVKVHKQVERSL